MNAGSIICMRAVQLYGASLPRSVQSLFSMATGTRKFDLLRSIRRNDNLWVHGSFLDHAALRILDAVHDDKCIRIDLLNFIF